MSKLIGNQEFDGDVYVKGVGGYDGTNPSSAQTLEQVVDDNKVLMKGSGVNSVQSLPTVSSTAQDIYTITRYYHVKVSANANSNVLNYTVYHWSSPSSYLTLSNIFENELDMNVVGTVVKVPTSSTSATITSYTNGTTGTITLSNALSTSAISDQWLYVYPIIGCKASGSNSIAVGDMTKSNGNCSIALGYGTVASASHSLAIGNIGNGYGTEIRSGGIGSIAFGAISPGSDQGRYSLINAQGAGSVAGGYIFWQHAMISTQAEGAFALGCCLDDDSNIQAGYYGGYGRGSFALGCANTSGDIYSRGDGSFAIGYSTATDSYIKSEGNGSIAGGQVGYGLSNPGYIHTTSQAKGGLAFGYAVGYGTIEASAPGSIALGNTDSGGGSIKAQGKGSFAGGYSTDSDFRIMASGDGSIAYGCGVTTSNNGEAAFGVSNLSNNGGSESTKTRFSVGVGHLDNYINAFEIMANGDVYIKGLGGYDGTNAGQSGVRTLQQILANV